MLVTMNKHGHHRSLFLVQNCALWGKCKKLVSLEWASVPDSSPRRYLFFVRLVIDTLGAPTGVWFKKLPVY